MKPKKIKRPRISRPTGETVSMAILLNDYELIMANKSKLSNEEKNTVLLRIQKLKECGLFKPSNIIEDQEATVIDETDQKNIN